jgi:hypothetical protein
MPFLCESYYILINFNFDWKQPILWGIIKYVFLLLFEFSGLPFFSYAKGDFNVERSKIINSKDSSL